MLAMNALVPRSIQPKLLKNLNSFKAVALLGPRQCGKSTLARQILSGYNQTVYLDLEYPPDRSKLMDPVLFFESNQGKLICIDEIQLYPDLFGILRSVIDRRGINGQFLLLGSASRDLIRQSSETLAGRIVYLLLSPFLNGEINNDGTTTMRYLLRGGFPDSYLAPDDDLSFTWRQSFISSFLERDISRLGFDYPPETMRRLWTFIAHSQGQMINLSEFGQLLGISHTTVRKYLELLRSTYMIRLLPPFLLNEKKRLAKTPKVYITDTGLVHALLNIANLNSLLGNPVIGASWETVVVENVLQTAEPERYGYYRTSNGAEIDLVIEKQGVRIGIECKASTAPNPEKGLFSAMNDLALEHVFVVAPVDTAYPLKQKVSVAPLHEVLSLINQKFVGQ